MSIKVLSNELVPLIIEELENKDVIITVEGSSMWPFFKSGVTKVKLSKKNEYKRLDVVLARYNNRYVLHRIVFKGKRFIYLRGDGLLRREVIEAYDIYAKVVSYTNKKEIKTSNFFYKFRVRIWLLLRPIRRIFLLFRK